MVQTTHPLWNCLYCLESRLQEEHGRDASVISEKTIKKLKNKWATVQVYKASLFSKPYPASFCFGPPTLWILISMTYKFKKRLPYRSFSVLHEEGKTKTNQMLVLCWRELDPWVIVLGLPRFSSLHSPFSNTLSFFTLLLFFTVSPSFIGEM